MFGRKKLNAGCFSWIIELDPDVRHPPNITVVRAVTSVQRHDPDLSIMIMDSQRNVLPRPNAAQLDGVERDKAQRIPSTWHL